MVTVAFLVKRRGAHRDVDFCGLIANAFIYPIVLSHLNAHNF